MLKSRSANQQVARSIEDELELSEADQYSQQTAIVTSLDDLAPESKSKSDPVTHTKSEELELINEILLEAIDETLSSLGQPVKNTVYFQLQNAFKINKEDIPERIDEFADYIRRVFGGPAARRIELKLIRTINAKLKDNPEYNPQDFDNMSFKEYVYSLRIHKL